MPAGRREIEQGAATRAALVEAAPRLFVEQGHFATDKQDLFRGVFHAIDAEVWSDGWQRHHSARTRRSIEDAYLLRPVS